MPRTTLDVRIHADREIVLSRTFDAPRTLVFAAMTEPTLIRRWLSGPPGWSLAECTLDLRVGGTYRYVWHGPNGERMGMGGAFREVAAPVRFVGTEKFDEPWYPGEAVGDFVLTEHGAKTLFTLTLRYQSREARDGVIATRMPAGAAAGYEKLAQLLDEIKGARAA